MTGHPKGKKNHVRTAEEKAALVKEFKHSAMTMTDFVASIGATRAVFRGWIMRFDSGGVEALRSGTGKGANSRRQSLAKKKSRTREEELEYENVILRIELERAKKGYAVKGGGSKRKEYVTLGRKNTRSPN